MFSGSPTVIITFLTAALSLILSVLVWLLHCGDGARFYLGDNGGAV
jgi:hypothetical protein